MATTTLTETFDRTARMDIHAIARILIQALGPSLVAVLAGVRDRKLPPKWSKDDGPEPRDESRRRLITAHRVWVALSETHGEHIARSWFVSLNPLLEETPPVVALNEGRDREVIEAARALLENDQAA